MLKPPLGADAFPLAHETEEATAHPHPTPMPDAIPLQPSPQTRFHLRLHLIRHILEVPLIALGQNHLLDSARCAAMSFSLIPPTGVTAPRKVISPVIASFGLTLRPESNDAMVVSIVTPADGPSLGIDPAGT